MDALFGKTRAGCWRLAIALCVLGCGRGDSEAKPSAAAKLPPASQVAPSAPAPTSGEPVQLAKPAAKPATKKGAPPVDENALQVGCERDETAACIALGDHLRQLDEPDAAALARAVELYDRACSRSDAQGCAQLGLMYQDGLGVERDLESARDLYSRACDAGAARACSRLGGMYLMGIGVERSVEQAFARSQTGCDGGDGMGCVNLGLMYQHGDGVDRDLERAVALLRRACDAHEARGCTLLGEATAHGEGTPQNVTLATMWNTRGCELGDGRGCGNVGVSHQLGIGARKSADAAAHYFGEACKAGETRYCELLQRFLRDLRGTHLPGDPRATPE